MTVIGSRRSATRTYVTLCGFDCTARVAVVNDGAAFRERKMNEKEKKLSR